MINQGGNMADKLFEIGKFKSEYNQNLNTQLPCLKIMQSNGLIKHISKKHPNQIKYLKNVKDILDNPDYIGVNPKEPDSIELVKVYADNILIAIKLDYNNGYYYLASLYDISNGKVNNRLNSGRLKKYLTF